MQKIKFFLETIFIIPAWIIIAPFSFFTIKRNIVVLIPRENGRFIDNVKYLFLYLHQNKFDITYYILVSNKKWYHFYKDHGFPVLFYPSIKSIYTLLRTKTIVADNWKWITGFKYQIFLGARKIQLWHGIPLKRIELTNRQNKKGFKLLLTKTWDILYGRQPRYEAVISTSEFYTEHAYKPSFFSKQCLLSGYPRNDCFFKSSPLFLLNTDQSCFVQTEKMLKEDYRIVLYAPTFRNRGSDAIKDGALNLNNLYDFGKKNKISFIFKFHPYMTFDNNSDYYPIIRSYDNSMDIYPFLPMTDLLITDYSSIFFDYLLLNKPIIFFPYDKKQYISEDRDFLFNYNDTIPGIQVFNEKHLYIAIKEILIERKDKFLQQRNDSLNRAYTYKDGNSSKRIMKFILTK